MAKKRGKRPAAHKGPGAQTAQQFAMATAQICRKRDEAAGRCSKSYDAETLGAVQLVRDTPAARRKEFAAAARSRRRNPGDTAAKLYEDFHGKAPQRETTIEQSVFSHDKLADLGALIDLQVIIGWDGDEAKVARIDFTGKQVRVAAAGNRTELHLVGGNQALDLTKLGSTGQAGKPTVFIGEAWKICYLTSKDFHDFRPSRYEHEFGEDDGGTRPHLNYDPRSKLMFLTGGSYRVERPGIIN